jgi:O-antigen ligase
MKQTIHQGIFRYCLLGIVFLMPVYGRFIPPLIALLVLNWIVEGRFKSKFNMIRSEGTRKQTLLFGLIYILYIAGLIYTTDFTYGLFDLQVKSSLLIFPLVFATSDKYIFSPSRRGGLLGIFVAGCFAGSLLLLSRAYIETVNYHVLKAFYYTGLSWYFHASYLSMYYNFAIAVLIGHLIKSNWKDKILWLVLKSFLVLWFIVLVFLLSSKAGILSLGGILLFYSILLMFKKNTWLVGLMILLFGAGIFYTTYRIIPGSFQRMETAGRVVRSDTTDLSQSAESTAERLSIWKASIEIIQEHYLLGVGTGDVKDTLYVKYAKNNMVSALKLKLNSHCQYLQTFIALGIIGFLVLVSMLLFPAIQAIRRRDYLYFLFVFLFAFNILVESMFETQAGIIFYAFFNAFLFLSMRYAKPSIPNIREE